MNKEMNKVMVAAVAGVLMASSNAAMAGDPVAGKTKSLSCAGCHGPAGMSPNPMWPNLAKQNADYTIKQLKAFRDGSRPDPMMSAMAMPLSDTDIEDLAAYFASL